ncbi:slipin family protein [Kitasatospora sp. GP82]|uniref:slipin family protein n=1 Tax=Kitasatospora sp. GP82 TaxID=3035089 RepID=UPI0024772BB4|nr:slipin family protein [Kitasatospora sp. GP82]MDH6124744.1 regulator of protease activity HflC (stomatin/prohibitin superfamily) [Kitasatospora sp. GP82]
MLIVDAILGAAGLVSVWAGLSIRVVQQWQRGVVFRFGRVREHIRQPGLVVLMPVADRIRRVNVQIVTMPIPAQEGITRDNVTVRVDAVVYFKVVDPVRASVNVQDYQFAISQVAQTSLRSIIGKSELDDLLANREPLNQGLELMLDSPALGWGIQIDRVEIKDVALPESMKRSMSRQAEAERERRARIITADGEFQASARLSEAATIMSRAPAALQLRLLQTVVEVAAEKNSTLVLPFPVELLRFLDNATKSAGGEEKGGDAAAAGPELSASPPEAGEVPRARAVEQLELPSLDEVLAVSPLPDSVANGSTASGSVPTGAPPARGEGQAEADGLPDGRPEG